MQAGVHQVLSRQAAAVGEIANPANDGLEAGFARIAEDAAGEIDPLHVGAGVDPLAAALPALDAGRIHGYLAHGGAYAGRGVGVGARAGPGRRQAAGCRPPSRWDS